MKFMGTYASNGSLITANYNTTVAGVFVENSYTERQPLFTILPNAASKIYFVFQTVVFFNNSQSMVNETVGVTPLILSINGVAEAVFVMNDGHLIINKALNSLISIQNTLGMVMFDKVEFISNYNSEALYLYSVAYFNAKNLTCLQNNFLLGVINPAGGACLNLRNVVTKVMNLLNVIECKSLNTSAGVKIFNDDSLTSMLPVFISKGLTPATLITNFNFSNNYANYNIFNEIGSAIYIDSIYPLSIDYGTFYVS